MHFSRHACHFHNPRPTLRNQVISSCCCDCIRINSHLFGGHDSHSYFTGSETEDEDMHFGTKCPHPSACHHIDMGERRRFFEHLNSSHDFSEDECLEYCRYCTKKQQMARYLTRHNWQKPQQRRRKCLSSCGFRRPQKHPYAHVRNRDGNLHQRQHKQFRYQTESESRPATHEYEYERGRNAEQGRFYQKINQAKVGFHHRHHQYAHSDVEKPNRLRTTIDQTYIHEHEPQTRRPVYSFDYQDDRPPYEVVSLWRRPNSPAGNHHSQEAVSPTPQKLENGGQPDYKWSLAKHQASREYLNSIQTVTKTRTDWEKRISTDPKFRNAIIVQRIEPGEGEGTLSLRGEAPRIGVEPNGGPNHAPATDEANAISTHTEETRVERNEMQNGQGEEYKNEIRARHSHSSPMIHRQVDTHNANANAGPKAKSHPRRHSGKFPHPEYEHFNLSSMKIPGHWSNSNSAEVNAGDIEKPGDENENAASSGGKQIPKKYFDEWRARARAGRSRKFPNLEKKEPGIKNGLLILSHSRSQQEIKTTTHDLRRVSTKTAATGTAASTKSAPPQPRPRRWFEILDSVNPWAPAPAEGPNQHATLTEPEREHESTAHAASADTGVDFAIEIDGRIPAERATSVTNETEKALQRLSADYNNVVAAGTRTESLDIRDSRLAFNVSLENIAKSKGCRSTGTGNHSQKQYCENSASTKKRHFEQRTVIGHRICQFCQQLITEPVEPHKVLQVQGRNVFWHRKCFRCAECETLLDSQHHYFWKGNAYCTQHYASIAQVPQCAACQEYIFDRTITLAMDHTWHKHHFQCLNCTRPLIDTKFVKIGSNSAICFECQQRLYSKNCVFCGQRILPTDIYVRSGDCFWHSNDTCINCQTCHRNLSHASRIFVRHGKTYCNRYCAQMNVSPAIALTHENPEEVKA